MLAVLVLVMAALISAYLVISSVNRAKEEREAAESAAEEAGVPLFSMTADDIIGYTYEKSGVAVSVEKVGDEWQLSDDGKFPLKQSTAESIAAGIASLSTLRTVDGDEADFGLDEPSLTVSVVTSGGASYKVEFGDVNTFNSNTYIRYNGSVYMIKDALSSLCKTDRSALIDITDSMPSALSADVLTSVQVTDTDGSTTTISDSDGMSGFFNIVKGAVTFKDFAGYGLDTDELDRYGVGDGALSVTFRYKTSASSDGTDTGDTQLDAYFTVRFGIGDDGEYYYAMPDGTVTYRTDESTYREICDYLDYTAPETESETSDAV